MLLAAVPRAEADCAADADRLRTHLVGAAPGVFRWNTAWAIAFGGAAVVLYAAATTETKPFGTFDQDFKESMYVGGAKATIGAAARLVLPLRVRVPPPNADRCADLAALRGSLAKLAGQEKRTFWLTHLGGFALNLSGALLLWHRRSFKVGAISFLMSFPISPLSAYTMPRRSWHLYREEAPTWSVGVGLGEHHATLGLVGEF